MRGANALRLLPVLVCRREKLEEADLPGLLAGLKSNSVPDVQVLEELVARDLTDLTNLARAAAEADVLLLCKPHLGLGDCVIKIAEHPLPLIIFSQEGGVRHALDALEYLYPRENTWVAIDYQDVGLRLKLLAARKKIANTKLLILNADYQHWARFLGRIPGGVEAIKARFGIEIEYVQSAEVIRRWQAIDDEKARAVAREWLAWAKRVIEPGEEDLQVVAQLYLVMKDLLEEKSAQGLTMAYGDDPLPVPCLAYTNLRDEGVPAACEADIISLLAMTMIHHLLDKPSFMGNTFVDLQDETITLNHCVAPTRMAGYESAPLPYTLRDQHHRKFPGSVSAFVELDRGQDVTICRLSGDLRSMLIARGRIVDCRDLAGYCRMAVRIKLEGPVREFIHSASGNHHLLVYGDHRVELRELNKLFGIATIEV
jgi:hypothetical protein